MPLTLTCEEVRAVDQVAIEEFGIPGLVLMENAGRGCVDLLCRLGVAGPVVVCCGKGNNAGDGFVIARHLAVRGLAAKVLLWCRPEQLAGDAAANYAMLVRTRVPMHVFADECDPVVLRAELAGADWVVDALLGTGSRGAPRPPLDRVIRCLNEAPARKLAVDLPSGLNADSGVPSPDTFRADHTATFVAAKRGFAATAAQACLGQVHVLDIGAPPEVLERVLNRKLAAAPS